VAEIESLVLIPDQFIKSSVLFKEIEIIEAGDEKDVSDAKSHQVLESLEAVAIAMLYPERVKSTFDGLEFGLHDM
jgi:hypothetical protein